jgi:hypothetical protein
MGIYTYRNGGSEDIQDESSLCDWHNPNTNLDHASRGGVVRLFPDSEY